MDVRGALTNMNARILLIDDDGNIRHVCQRFLEREGYEVFAAADGLEGWQQFLKVAPDLIVMDLMMPNVDGLKLCEEIRQQSDVPIIMLTARGDERDRLVGLTLGSDDYITKPFSPRELVLRVRNILRRLQPSGSIAVKANSLSLEFDGLTIDPTSRRARVRDRVVELTVKEFDVLYLMARRPGQVFSRMQLLDLVWNSEHGGDANTVTVLIRRLREKLEPNPAKPYWIHTVWGIGYRFEPGGEDDS